MRTTALLAEARPSADRSAVHPPPGCLSLFRRAALAGRSVAAISPAAAALKVCHNVCHVVVFLPVFARLLLGPAALLLGPCAIVLGAALLVLAGLFLLDLLAQLLGRLLGKLVLLGAFGLLALRQLKR